MNGRTDLSPNVRFGAATELTSRPELASVIAQTVRGEFSVRDSARFCAELLGPIDGQATARIRASIIESCRHRNPA